MWLVLAFLSAALLGFYDVCKKYSLRGNAVLPILFLNTLFCSIIFLPMAFQTPFGGWEVQRYILLKACIVLSSWLLGYIGIKHLPQNFSIGLSAGCMHQLQDLPCNGDAEALFLPASVVAKAIGFLYIKPKAGRQHCPCRLVKGAEIALS